LGRAQKAHIHKALLLQFRFESCATAEEVARGEVIEEDDSTLAPVFDRPCRDHHGAVAHPDDRARDAMLVAQIAATRNSPAALWHCACCPIFHWHRCFLVSCSICEAHLFWRPHYRAVDHDL
jgi:hypothetical protein